jgi:hypothetical protein
MMPDEALKRVKMMPDYIFVSFRAEQKARLAMKAHTPSTNLRARFPRPSIVAALCVAALAAMAPGAQAGHAEFKADVNAAIDAGLAYSRANNYFTSIAPGAHGPGNGLALLTLLEKETIPAGYNGLDAADKQLAQNAACILIDSGTFGDRGGFYSYYDGQVLMGLSVYLDTGGPDEPAASAGFNCTGRSARQTIDKVVDRSLAAQTPGAPALYGPAGYWGYTGNGYDSSTTQFTIAGLAAAKGFYASQGESLDKNRLPLITAALDKTSLAYSLNGKANVGGQFDTCGAGCLGHGYQSNYGAGNNSSQQTASGTWNQLAGTGKNVNDASIQGYLRWLQNAYSHTTNIRPDSWPEAYFYYLWSSSKAYNIIDAAGVPLDAGNIDPADMGTLPAVAGREVNRDPALDTRPPARGAGAAGYYAGTPKGWYYDYAHRLMSLQNAAGQFPNPNGSWSVSADHSYAILVLQRSIGGACTDTDLDGVCDKDDNCVNKANPNQEDKDGDGVGDVCDNCPNTSNPDQADLNGNKIGDACEGKCDVDKDGDIDKVDTSMISKARGKTVPPLDQAYDATGDGNVSPADVKACIPLCTRPNCATQ